MRLTDEQIIQFQCLFKNRYKKQIDRVKAEEKATQLINLCKSVLQAVTNNENETTKTTINR